MRTPSLASLLLVSLTLSLGPQCAWGSPGSAADPQGELREPAADDPLDLSVTREVTAGEPLRIELSANSGGVAHATLRFDPDGQVWVLADDVDGYELEASSARHTKSKALLYQIGTTGLLVHARWTDADGGWLVEARVSSDREANSRLLAASEEEENSARLLRDARAVSPAELDEDVRIAAWARLWAEVRANFAFFDQVPDLDWDATLDEVLPQVRAARTAPAFYRLLERTLARLQDGHTSVWGPGLRNRGDAWLPVRLEFDAARRLRVASEVFPSALQHAADGPDLAAAGLAPGQVVTHWNGRAVAEHLDLHVRPWICASTPQHVDLVAAERLARGSWGERVELTLEGEAGPRTVTLRRARHPQPQEQRQFRVEELDHGILLVELPSFTDGEGPALVQREWSRLRLATGLIFDVRANGGGNSGNGWSIVSRLISERIHSTAWRTRELRPAFRAWGRPEAWYAPEPGWIEPAADPFLGPVAVLIGPRTFSAAEDFVVVLHAAERATLVGAPTGGSTGQPLFLDLPGGGGARICTKRDTYPDGREFVGVGVQPDEAVESWASGAADDPVLARALQIVWDEAEGRR